MPPLFTIDPDPREVLEAFDALAGLIEEEAQREAFVTGYRIQADARSRLQRQTHGEGQTAENITVSDTVPSHLGGDTLRADASVYVYVRPYRRPDNLTLWLEFGTKFMTPRPFLRNAVEGQRADHMRRMFAAAQRGIDRAGG